MVVGNCWSIKNINSLSINAFVRVDESEFKI